MKRYVFFIIFVLPLTLFFATHGISHAQYEGAGARIFVTDVRARDEVTGSTTSRILDFSWVVPWSIPHRFVALDEEGDFVAVAPIISSSTATSTQSGVISVASPEFGAYTYVVRVCDNPGSASTCVRSEPVTIDIGENDIRLESEMKSSDFPAARASELENLRQRIELSWTRALLFARMHDSGTTTIAELSKMRRASLSVDRMFWGKARAQSRCVLDTIETNFPLIDRFARERCTNGATSTEYFPSDADIMDGLSRAKSRTARSSGIENYKVGSPEKDTPILVGVYEDSDVSARATAPTQLPLSSLGVLQYDALLAGDDGHLSFIDSYNANEEYLPGQCEKLDCTHGFLAEITRMKKANPKLRVQVRISISDRIFASSTFRDTLASDAQKFLVAHPLIDGFDLVPHSATGTRMLSSLVHGLKNKNDGNPILLSASVSCMTAECLAGLNDLGSQLDYIFVSPLTGVASGARHLAPLDVIASEVKKFSNSKILTTKIIIDVPLRAKLWSDGVVYGLDLRTVRSKYMGKSDFERVWDDKAQAATLVSSSTGLISYEDDDAIANKALFVMRSKLGGIRLVDTMSDDGTLATRVARVFGGGEKVACAISMLPPRNLAENSRGRDVRALQDFLRCKDFIPGYIELNGNYGSITSAAVKLFQLSEGIEPLGTVGTSTRSSLARYLAN